MGFDFAVRTVSRRSDFWVRAETLEVAYNHSALAVLRNRGASTSGSGGDPRSSRRPCTSMDRCKVLNCPFPAWPPSMFTDCLQVDQLKNADHDDVPPNSDVVEHFFNFVFEPSINNRRFADPAAPPLTQPADANMIECADECDTRSFPQMPCECTHYRTIPFNTTVQVVAMNLGMGAFGMHPLHLHG